MAVERYCSAGISVAISLLCVLQLVRGMERNLELRWRVVGHIFQMKCFESAASPRLHRFVKQVVHSMETVPLFEIPQFQFSAPMSELDRVAKLVPAG